MVFRQSLGIIDALSAISCAAIFFGHPLGQFQAAMGLALIGKGAFFIEDIVSVLDIACGIVMFLLLWFSWPTIALSLAIYLGFKATLSLLPF
jgi:Na+/H+ antiporter NhaA